MKTKKFHLGDILSITTGILFSPRGVEGVYDILGFMTGNDLYTHQLPRASDECLPHLKYQHPELFGPEMDFAVGEFKEMAKRVKKEDLDNLLLGWLYKQAGRLGMVNAVDMMFPIVAIPEQDQIHKKPVSELREMLDGKEGKTVPIIKGSSITCGKKGATP